MTYSRWQRALAPVVGAVARTFFGMTLRHVRTGCRWTVRGPLDAALKDRGRPLVLAIWHQDVVPMFHYLIATAGFEERRRFVMLASRSFDGELTRRILEPWGYRFVRGSTGKRGARASLLGLCRAVEAGESVIIVADGPKPPARRMQPGAPFVAQATGAPLYVARAWGKPQWLMAGTKFRMVLPLPRSRFALFSERVDTAGTPEQIRAHAEGTLLSLCADADAELYLRRHPREAVRLVERAARARMHTRLL
ncbi:MAG: DUF374 domain-containing protein [Planctomycetota bacterium]|nr:DUF374 domain-containing protein [Planctomycetota bacterium]